MKNKKLITFILMLAMLMSAALTVFAADGDGEEAVVKIDYTQVSYSSPESKLREMNLFYENDDYEIYGLEATGEVAIKVKSTEQILLSNPYTLADDNAASDVKAKILSQIILKYTDNDVEYTFDSYTQAAVNNQIKFKKIRDGVRVEYTIGREEVRKLVPRMIEKERFETAILDKIEDKTSRDYKKLLTYYMLKDASDPKLSKPARDAMLATMPITKKYAVYVLDPSVVEKELYDLEATIVQSGYSYEDMVADHAMVNYTGTEKAPPLFKLAIEYHIDDNGIKIRIPGSGIRYDAENYKLKSIQLLPYLCAGSKENTGYTMIPDGSGTLVRFEDVADKTFTLTSKMYGYDFSFHKINGSNQETMRLPAFGIVEDKKERTEGFVAYVEEGESMCEISTEHGGKLHGYNSTFPIFYPRPGDTYALTSISSTGSATWSVDSERKYTGNYTIRLMPLVDDKANYVGMAETLRDYLVNKGILSKLEDDGKNSIPLYVENFGDIETVKKGWFGVPVNKKTPLTTFEDTRLMLEELKAEGITNVNIKFRGWYNGGLESTAPAKLSVEKVLGGVKGLKKLVEYAKENNVGIYPDFEFTYVENSSTFDGFDYKDDCVKTIDDRSAQHRVYSALYQGFEEDGALILSPKAMKEFYENISKKYISYGVEGISVASLGSDLSSDHNEDYPMNREEAKDMIKVVLSEMKEDNKSLMTSGGNAYALEYADHILDMPLDSSMNISASESIPFVSMVLHGFKEYSGYAINLEGDYSYAILKAIESGANPYFILSYREENAAALKNYKNFSKYYSIRYDIWKEDLISTYNTLNQALKDVRFATISGHEYIDDKLVKVTYSNGISFILNYSIKDITYDGEKVGAMNFIKKG